MIHQTSFSQVEFADKKKIPRRERFLTRMEEVIPWTQLLAVLEPFYPKGERGRPPIGLERMLRVYFLQQWYGLADEALEDALYDSQALRGFARIDLAADGVPDATTLLKFRRLLETHDLCRGLFTAINADLAARGLLLREGTLVDAMLIAAPSSTKNQEMKRDPEMHQTKKGNQWHFGMKAHMGADRDSKLVHTVVVTAANVADRHLAGTRTITVSDPYVRLFYQARNLMEFLQVVHDLVPEGDEVAVHLKTQSDMDSCVKQEENLNQIAHSFTGSRVAFSWEFDHNPNFHARHITTDTGWKITVDRGLDIYQKFEAGPFSLEQAIQEARLTRGAEVTYLRV